MSARPVSTFITIIMDLLVVLAVILTASVVVQFFGSLAAQTWGQAIVKIGDLMTLPAGIAAIKTPYGGIFDANAVLTIVVFLLAEWVLSVVRSRA